jgi:hypothetical protein
MQILSFSNLIQKFLSTQSSSVFILGRNPYTIEIHNHENIIIKLSDAFNYNHVFVIKNNNIQEIIEELLDINLKLNLLNSAHNSLLCADVQYICKFTNEINKRKKQILNNLNFLINYDDKL